MVPFRTFNFRGIFPFHERFFIMLFTLRKTNGSLNAVLKISEKQTFSRPSERAVQMLHTE